jgi:hypothetical protein
MNFVLLDYSEGKPEKEVLFGWGRYGHRSSESVFRSSHHRLVLEFEKLYDNLSKSSDSLSITQLPESIAALAESPTISADWDMGMIETRVNSKLGQFLMENWEEYWNPKSPRGAASQPDANQSGGSR